MFKKVLIANRGEIALRVIRACKELGIATVAVHSTADTHSLHVIQADEDICIGPPNSKQSYLDMKQIISAAELTNADAIHPGYGFLSENAHFAEICRDNRLVFIGPSPEVIRSMGDKAEAKATMRRSKVPTIPGSEGLVLTLEDAIRAAKKVGYPVIVKATAGGGGRGMRVAHDEAELKKVFPTASAEAQSAFGRGDLYLERYFTEPRHVEIQLLGDAHGNMLYLGERDCSVQRRHQKLIEESPSPAVTPEIRRRMGETAARGALEAGYTNAGTIEFLYDTDNSYYFMEMNTRIQVEHPVTECVTGIDLVQAQILVAAGEKLPYTQKDIHVNGHAIECRINAEDPFNDFKPSPGTLTAFNLPGGPGVRIDTHCYGGYQVPPNYDSMIAKLIVHAPTRAQAIARMLRALDEFVIEGVKTTIPLHKRILKHPQFVKGEYTTKFLEQYSDLLLPRPCGGLMRSITTGAELRGVWPALFTPLCDDDPKRLRNSIDYDKAKLIIDDLIVEGVTGLVPVGTTGQSPTVSTEQHLDYIRFVADYVDGRVPVLAGAGSNSTRESTDMIQAIKKSFDDMAVLCVTGYYNNPPQEGLAAHYETLSRETGAKIVIYNVPARTASYLEAETLIRLAEDKNIIGLKQAVDFRSEGKFRDDTKLVIEKTKNQDFGIVSGEDDGVFAIMELGGSGVISASGTIAEASRLYLNLVATFNSGDVAGAKQFQDEAMAFVKLVFARKNPIPLGTFFNSPLFLPLVWVRETKGGIELETEMMKFIDEKAPLLNKYHKL